MALVSTWNWTEVAEGSVVSLVFVLLPLLWRVEKHHKAAMRAHDRHAKHLKAIREKVE